MGAILLAGRSRGNLDESRNAQARQGHIRYSLASDRKLSRRTEQSRGQSVNEV